ncbi:hypothetical protein B0H19DRAFT_429152 [Mycena capillaripes]|nr:hypothetical protein B0H19DRAFT_429152 [Mycena capillaripes]
MLRLASSQTHDSPGDRPSARPSQARGVCTRAYLTAACAVGQWHTSLVSGGSKLPNPTLLRPGVFAPACTSAYSLLSRTYTQRPAAPAPLCTLLAKYSSTITPSGCTSARRRTGTRMWAEPMSRGRGMTWGYSEGEKRRIPRSEEDADGAGGAVARAHFCGARAAPKGGGRRLLEGDDANTMHWGTEAAGLEGVSILPTLMQRHLIAPLGGTAAEGACASASRTPPIRFIACTVRTR